MMRRSAETDLATGLIFYGVEVGSSGVEEDIRVDKYQEVIVFKRSLKSNSGPMLTPLT